ncbi:unnamed protein product [Thlaspi arvense]|uniref:Cytochrome P450 n=1 Tax=Thlaspi arvense TaxID=13288 RepID=A0AAU9TAD4_THLAR|nr:unnamed protein product [Thlaspi arvense]
MEWAMSLLVNHPEVLKKAREEIDSHVGQDRLVDELDLSNLHYLHAIISKTFRLFPAAPLLVPHMPLEDYTIGGYYVPRGSILLVNAWSIHRDPEVWMDDPTSFKPERFEGRKCFEWERGSEKPVDLREGKGTTMPKLEPLEVMCKARPIMKQGYSLSKNSARGKPTMDLRPKRPGKFSLG